MGNKDVKKNKNSTQLKFNDSMYDSMYIKNFGKAQQHFHFIYWK